MPRGSMAKYFADQGGPQHGGTLNWPGTLDGFPVRGDQVPMTRGDEAADVPLALDFHSQRFCLWDPQEHQAFNGVMDKVANGWYMQHKRIDRWSDEHSGMIVWLEWVQIYGEVAGTKHPGISNVIAQQHPGSGYQGIAPAGQDGHALSGYAIPGPG